MDCVGDLVAECSSELVAVFHEIKKRIDDVYISARSCERIRLRFVNQIELERMAIFWLRRASDRIGKRSQLIVQGGRLNDLTFGLQFVEDFLAELHFFVLILLLRRCVDRCSQTKCHFQALENVDS